MYSDCIPGYCSRFQTKSSMTAANRKWFSWAILRASNTVSFHDGGSKPEVVRLCAFSRHRESRFVEWFKLSHTCTAWISQTDSVSDNCARYENHSFPGFCWPTLKRSSAPLMESGFFKAHCKIVVMRLLTPWPVGVCATSSHSYRREHNGTLACGRIPLMHASSIVCNCSFYEFNVVFIDAALNEYRVQDAIFTPLVLLKKITKYSENQKKTLEYLAGWGTCQSSQ